MNIKTVYFNATDKVELRGILYKSNKKTEKILISIHGMATNFLKEREEAIAEEVNKINIDYLTFNNRGHDLCNYIRKEIDGKKVKQICGTSYEDVLESSNDICGAIDWALDLGYEEIYLMGHSLGATKVVYSYNKLKNENSVRLNNIKAVLLLSLIDIPTAIKVYLRDNFPAVITYAKNMKKENMENELMPENSFIHPISVKTFLRYAIDNNDIDFARYSDEDYDFKELNNIDVPLFMRWGNDKEMILQNAQDLCNVLSNRIKNRNLDINYIDKANHSYTGKESILSEQIKLFLEKLEVIKSKNIK